MLQPVERHSAWAACLSQPYASTVKYSLPVLHCRCKHGGEESWFAVVLDLIRRRRRKVERQRRKSSPRDFHLFKRFNMFLHDECYICSPFTVSLKKK